MFRVFSPQGQIRGQRRDVLDAMSDSYRLGVGSTVRNGAGELLSTVLRDIDIREFANKMPTGIPVNLETSCVFGGR